MGTNYWRLYSEQQNAGVDKDPKLSALEHRFRRGDVCFDWNAIADALRKAVR